MSDRPAILLVHGAWHGAWCWEAGFAPWLRARGHRVETIDLPRHGIGHTRRIGFPSIRDYADAVEKKVRSIGQPVVVAGHSMGGHVTQKLMERRPTNLVGAALIASVPPHGVFKTVLALLRHRPLDLLWATVSMNLYHLVREPRFARELFYGDELDEAALRQYWLPVQNESFRAFMDMIAFNLPRPSRADSALPKWVIGGERDALFSPEDVRRTARAYGVEAHIYPGKAHSLIVDVGWEQVASDFAEWVGQIEMARVA